MVNLVLGIIILVASILLSRWAWVNYRATNYRVSLFVILLLALILRVFVSIDMHLHEWDERYHALVAKNMIDHPFQPMLYEDPVLPYDYRHWYANHIWVHKQPVPLWSMALSMAVFGVNEVALRLPSVLLSTLVVFCTFLIGKHLFNEKIGLLAAFFHAIHGLTIELTAGRVATDHIDLYFLVFIELSVLFALYHAQTKKFIHLVLIALFCGLAIMTKWLPALIVFPIWGGMMLKYQKRNLFDLFGYGMLALLMVTMVALPWQIYIDQRFPLEAAWERAFNIKHIFEGLDGHDQPFGYFFRKIRTLFGELIYLPGIWLIYIMIKKKKWNYLILGTWIIIPLLFFSLVKTKMQGYLLFTAPAYFILIAVFIRYLMVIRFKVKYPIILQLVAIGLLISPIWYGIERSKLLSERDRSLEWAEQLKLLDNRLKKEEKYVLVGEDHYIEAMFYCDGLTAYPYVPEQEQLVDMKARGYQLLIKREEGGEIRYKDLSLKENK